MIDLLEIGEKALSFAEKLNVSEVEVYLVQNTSKSCLLSGKIDVVKSNVASGIGVRVIIDKKIGVYGITNLEENEVEKAVEKAVKIAKASDPDLDFRELNKKFGKSSVSGIYDREIAEMDIEKIFDAADTLITSSMDYNEIVQPTRGIIETSTWKVAICNSHGIEAERKGTGVVTWFRCKAKDGGKEASAGESKQARRWKDIDFSEVATSAASKAVSILDATLIENQKLPVIWHNKFTASMVDIMFGNTIDAYSVQKGRSPWKDKVGQQIASEDFNLVDDGVMEAGLRTRAFDDEGVATRKTPIIEKGELKGFLYDTYTANKEGAESTGNAFRTYRSNPLPAPSNLILKPGNAKREEIIEETRKGLLVVDVIGEWLSNPISGEMSATVVVGYLVENGEIKKPVKGIMISGNFHQIIKDGIELIGDDITNVGGVYAPTIKVSEMTIAGRS